jgi:peptidoglycan/LPS O-acetylase OafA/YrhL
VARRRASLALVTLAAAMLWPQLIGGFAVWLLGSLLYYADRHQERLHQSGRVRARLHLAAGSLALAAVLATIGSGNEVGIRAEADLLVGLAFSWALWGLLRGALTFPRWLGWAARYGAGASFSLYVTHIPLFALALAAIGYRARQAPDLATLGLIAMLCALAVIAAWLFSRVTEARTAQVRRLLRERRGWPRLIRRESP